MLLNLDALLLNQKTNSMNQQNHAKSPWNEGVLARCTQSMSLAAHARLTQHMNLDNDCATLAASQFNENTGELTIQPNDPDFPDIVVSRFHLSCASDAYNPDHRYAGFIIYGKGSEVPPFILNGRKVFPGYLVIRDSDIPEVLNQSAPTIHGKVYQSVFGSESSVSSDHIAGEGFSIKVGVFTPHSSTFNDSKTPYHDHVRSIAAITLGPIKKSRR